MANLRLSLRLLTKHFNGVYRYPVLLAHDVPLTKGARRELAALARPARLSFARVVNEPATWQKKWLTCRLLKTPTRACSRSVRAARISPKASCSIPLVVSLMIRRRILAGLQATVLCGKSPLGQAAEQVANMLRASTHRRSRPQRRREARGRAYALKRGRARAWRHRALAFWRRR